MNREAAIAAPAVAFGEALRVWGRIGLLSFGGPAGQIALMHRELVEERRWIGEADFLHALNYCMLLPGPEAQQLATYVGWRMHGVVGGIVAGTLFILPGFFAILGLSILYATVGKLPLVEAVFLGLRAAVIALVLQALLRMGKRLVGNRVAAGVAVAAFVALFVFGAPFPLVVLAAGLFGFLMSRAGSDAFRGGGHGSMGADAGPPVVLPVQPDGPAFRAGIAFLVAWLVPVAAIVALMPGSVFADIATFFSQMAVVTFGGAYAVLAWVADVAVTGYGWLAPGEMLDGLALAETTPGPLILVLEFVGFLAAFRDPGALSPLVAGVLGAVLTVLVTFLPCFAWIFVGAPFAERLRENRALKAALAAVSAAVVGVVATLSLWFALHGLFGEHRRVGGLKLELPVLASVDLVAVGLTALALWLAFGRKTKLPMLLGLPAGMAVALFAVGV
jgi:chromate transporter